MAIGELLRELREKKGWTAREAAKRLGVSYTRIGEVEAGQSRTTGKPTAPSYDFLIKAARGYDFPLTKLLEAAGFETNAADLAQEAEMTAIFRRLSPKSRDLAIALLRTVEGQDEGANL